MGLNLINNFKNLIDSCDFNELSQEDQSIRLRDFLRLVTLHDIVSFLQYKIEKEKKMIQEELLLNPPLVYPLFKYKGFAVEVTYWYFTDLVNNQNYEGNYAHDHFGYMATRMLKGDGYLETKYSIKTDGKITPGGLFEFKENSDRIIEPNDIHSIEYRSNNPSISIRIILPDVKEIMAIYDKKTGEKISEANFSTQRKGNMQKTLSHLLNLLIRHQ